MTRIRASCPTCGDVDLRPGDIQLEVVQTERGDVANGSIYRFSCPTCTDLVTKPADKRIVKLLSTGGVAMSVRDKVPPHPEDPPRGPAFTYDDLLDFHDLLADDGWMELLEQHLGH